MDRFVRGDASRNTEGSGLGLAIARDLTQLQRGTFALTIDGDLFKATLTFPRCQKTQDQRENKVENPFPLWYDDAVIPAMESRHPCLTPRKSPRFFPKEE